jgi:hypothetical protein
MPSMIYGRRRLIINLGCEACIQKINGVFSGLRLSSAARLKISELHGGVSQSPMSSPQVATQHKPPTPLMNEARDFLPQKDI